MSGVWPILFAVLTFTKGESLEIAAGRCDFDRREGVAYFEGAVRVDYRPGYTLCADRLFAFFEGTNDLQRIVALGNVAVTNEGRFGSCDKAVFRRRAGEIEMFATKDGARARLVDPGASEASGRKIKFWLEGEQVEIVDSKITVNKGKERVKVL